MKSFVYQILRITTSKMISRKFITTTMLILGFIFLLFNISLSKQKLKIFFLIDITHIPTAQISSSIIDVCNDLCAQQFLTNPKAETEIEYIAIFNTSDPPTITSSYVDVYKLLDALNHNIKYIISATKSSTATFVEKVLSKNKSDETSVYLLFTEVYRPDVKNLPSHENNSILNRFKGIANRMILDDDNIGLFTIIRRSGYFSGVDRVKNITLLVPDIRIYSFGVSNLSKPIDKMDFYVLIQPKGLPRNEEVVHYDNEFNYDNRMKIINGIKKLYDSLLVAEQKKIIEPPITGTGHTILISKDKSESFSLEAPPPENVNIKFYIHQNSILTIEPPPADSAYTITLDVKSDDYDNKIDGERKRVFQLIPHESSVSLTLSFGKSEKPFEINIRIVILPKLEIIHKVIGKGSNNSHSQDKGSKQTKSTNDGTQTTDDGHNANGSDNSTEKNKDIDKKDDGLNLNLWIPIIILILTGIGFLIKRSINRKDKKRDKIEDGTSIKIASEEEMEVKGKRFWKK